MTNCPPSMGSMSCGATSRRTARSATDTSSADSASRSSGPKRHPISRPCSARSRPSCWSSLTERTCLTDGQAQRPSGARRCSGWSGDGGVRVRFTEGDDEQVAAIFVAATFHQSAPFAERLGTRAQPIRLRPHRRVRALKPAGRLLRRRHGPPSGSPQAHGVRDDGSRCGPACRQRGADAPDVVGALTRHRRGHRGPQGFGSAVRHGCAAGRLDGSANGKASEPARTHHSMTSYVRRPATTDGSPSDSRAASGASQAKIDIPR